MYRKPEPQKGEAPVIGPTEASESNPKQLRKGNDMSNSMPKTYSQEVVALMAAALTGPILTTPRALIVSLDKDGTLAHKPVGMGQSILNIETELFDHLNSKPIETSFLEELLAYCEGRLAARAEAARTGGFAIPRAKGVWEIHHQNAFTPVVVGGEQ